MRVLIIGSGGREHALAWKLSQSPKVKELHIAPGNGGTGAWRNAPIDAGDVKALAAYIREQNINFVVPGPELALVAGITDACREMGVPCFGPDAFAANLEGSKVFAKEVMQEAGVPTAAYAIFDNFDAAAAYVKEKGAPIVIKADGLAAGKGVVVARTVEEALAALDDMLRKGSLGSAAKKVLLEEALFGEEASLLAFCDGETALPLPSAQDHKTVNDGDTGPNTGGMGAYSPAPILPDEQLRRVCDLVITPILRCMKAKGHPFTGVLYAGLMITEQGPKVIEYNVRFGDPECQPLLMRLDNDLLEVLEAATQGKLHDVDLKINPQHTLCVVLAASGYPGSYPKGMPISGIDDAEKDENVKVFHAGTKLENGQIVSAGGRILGITARGADLQEAQKTAYAALDKIHMPNAHFRRDIGAKGLKRCWACSK